MPAITKLKLSAASPDEVKARLKELKSDLVEMAEGRRSDPMPDDAFADMLREVDLLDTHLTSMAAEDYRSRLNVLATAGARPAGAGMRSLGDLFVNSEDTAEWIRRGLPDAGFSVELTGAEGQQAARFLRAGYRATVTEWAAGGPQTPDATGSEYLNPVGQPIAPVPRQARLFLRDLIPVMTTTLATVPYVRELNPTTSEQATGGGAVEVAEAGLKPSATLSFSAQQASPTVIATTLRLSKQIFEDSPAVIQYINNRLPYLVKFREDGELLNGNGVWPNIPGITTIGGVQSQSATVGQTAQTIGNAIAKVENVDGDASAVVFNPVDAWNMFTLRAVAGAGTFDAGTPFSALPLTIWGVPTYRSRAYAQGKALVGDFQLGAMLADREQVNVNVYKERYADTNEVLLICEERLAPLWLRPDAFVQATIA
ncbi:MAG: hypothetical protein JWO62_2632 [Acidimicrobiaceae bacterium]|nr:hypothetical protein [Acidimicrobiaceae bacterium]